MHPRYEILFEPLTIGAIIAPNRFYQETHASPVAEYPPGEVI